MINNILFLVMNGSFLLVENATNQNQLEDIFIYKRFNSHLLPSEFHTITLVVIHYDEWKFQSKSLNTSYAWLKMFGMECY